MREILFRGKLHSGEWAYGNLVVSKNGIAIITPDDTPLGKYGQVAPETVGQYTGLEDKNGKRIFEGDIVRHYNCGKKPDKYDTGVIFFEATSCAFMRTTEMEAVLLRISKYCEYEVVGNIYDNPEPPKEVTP
ncbi:MAG: hypothetical protein IJX71_01835 [Oscillospiraceae bacterium]|nr:hypothetical protein [Oscillospiraceae bacterium]